MQVHGLLLCSRVGINEANFESDSKESESKVRRKNVLSDSNVQIRRGDARSKGTRPIE